MMLATYQERFHMRENSFCCLEVDKVDKFVLKYVKG